MLSNANFANSKNPLKVILCFGDSGNGKSTFVNCFVKDKSHQLLTSSDGHSCTKTCQNVNGCHPEIGELDFLDTRGTNDTEEYDNGPIFEGLLDYMKQEKRALKHKSMRSYIFMTPTVFRDFMAQIDWQFFHPSSRNLILLQTPFAFAQNLMISSQTSKKLWKN